MKQLTNLAVWTLGVAALAACAPLQPRGGQTYGNGNQSYGYGNQQSYGYGNQQQPYGYGNNQSANPMSSALGTAAELALIGILTGQLGINQQQALGGAGSIFQVAQQRMQPADFSRLSAAVPGMDRYLAAVPQAAGNGSNNLWNAAGNMMGGPSGNLGSLVALAGTFQSLGMNADMVGRFVPVMLQYVEQQGGQSTMSLLQNSLY